MPMPTPERGRGTLTRMLDWDDLRIFLAVARTRRLAVAARQLSLDATTVGRRLARLSQTLGTEMFELSGGERRLTAQGQALLAHAEDAERAALAALEQATGEQHGLAGQVRLSVAEGFGTWVLAPGFADLQMRHPGIRLDLITSSGFLNPSKREADMAVLLARPQRGRLAVRKMADYTLRPFAAKTYLERAGEPRTRAELRQHVLVGYVPEFIFAPELDYLDEIEPGLEPHFRSTSINVQHRMIAGGAGIGVLPDFIARHDARLAPVLEGDVEIRRSFWRAVHEDMRKLARIEAVALWVEERIAQMDAALKSLG